MARQKKSHAASSIKYIESRYDHAHSETSALDLIYEVAPQWRIDPGPVKIVRFTDGIMNTVG